MNKNRCTCQKKEIKVTNMLPNVLRRERTGKKWRFCTSLNKAITGFVVWGENPFTSPQEGNCISANLRILQLACLFSMLRVAGCVSWSDTASDGSMTTHVIGYTKVKHPPIWASEESPQVFDITNIGVSFSREGMILGYGNKALVSFPPSDHGYILIDVRSEKDLQHVIGILQHEQNKRYPVCLTINAIGASR